APARAVAVAPARCGACADGEPRPGAVRVRAARRIPLPVICPYRRRAGPRPRARRNDATAVARDGRDAARAPDHGLDRSRPLLAPPARARACLRRLDRGPSPARALAALLPRAIRGLRRGDYATLRRRQAARRPARLEQ